MSSIRDYINNKYSIYDAYQLSLGAPAPLGKCFCPFHDNTHSPAAKVYQYGLRCFGECNRVYTSYDFLKKFRPDIIEQESKVILPPEQPKQRQKLNRLVLTPDDRKSNSKVIQLIAEYYGIVDF